MTKENILLNPDFNITETLNETATPKFYSLQIKHKDNLVYSQGRFFTCNNCSGATPERVKNVMWLLAIDSLQEQGLI